MFKKKALSDGKTEVELKSNLSLSVGAKVMGIVVIVLALMAIQGALSGWQMTKVGHEIESIAERDMPIATALTQITIHQLEQAINFERAMRIGEVLDKHPSFRADLEKTIRHFNDLGVKVDEEIAGLNQVVDSAVAAAQVNEDRSLLMQAATQLKSIASEHKSYHNRAGEALNEVNDGNVEAALAMLPQIEKQEEHLDHAVEALLLEVEQFTQDALKTAEEHEKFAFKLMVIILVLAVFVGLAVSLFMVRRTVTGPLKEVVRGLDALAAGDFSVDVPIRADDEVGAVARSYVTFKDAIRKTNELETAQEKQKLEAEEKNRSDLLQVADRFESSIGQIVSAVSGASTELDATAQSMSSISEETNCQANSVAAATEEATVNVQSVAAATQEMSNAITEAAQRVRQTSDSSNEAVAKVEATGQEMAILTSTAERINQVISMISEIADQTNLLALNATIESARAGEAGKGFAVVAGEVKELAGQTAKATEEITRHIEEIQGASARAGSSMNEVQTAIKDVANLSLDVASAMEQQQIATQEISHSLQEAAAGTQEVAQNVMSVSQASQEAGAAATQVLSSAGLLSKQSEVLNGEVTAFLAGLREGPADRRENRDPDYQGAERRKVARAA